MGVKRHSWLLLLILSALAVWFACEWDAVRGRALPSRVSDLTYRSGTEGECRIYLMESGRYVPFLALENDDSGATLLVREYALDETRVYNAAVGAHSTCYADSDIDRYLNDAYFHSLSGDVAAQVLEAQVEVTSPEGLAHARAETTRIVRHVFLLSANEICGELASLTAREGRALAYFRAAERKRLTFENGEAATWFTRTPALSESVAVIAVSGDGSVGLCPIASAVGPTRCAVRPALRVASDAAVIRWDIDGEAAFVLAANTR